MCSQCWSDNGGSQLPSGNGDGASDGKYAKYDNDGKDDKGDGAGPSVGKDDNGGTHEDVDM